MGSHLIDGKFQSDKYPTTPRGFVPLKCSDKDAQPHLWAYAQAHRARDAGFTDDVETALKLAGYEPPTHHQRLLDRERDTIVGLTSTAARIVGLCLRDKRENLIDEAVANLTNVGAGLEAVGRIAGSDTGCEYTLIAIRQLVGWMRARNHEALLQALQDRYLPERQPWGYYASMAEACRQQGIRTS